MATWLDDLLGKTILQNNEPLPDRKKLNFRSGPDLSIADNPRLESTDISLQGAASVKAFGDVVAAVSGSGSDTSDVRPPVLSDGDYAAYPFATLQAALNALPSILDGHTVTLRIAAGTYDGANLSGIFGGGKLRICAPYTLQTITGANTGAAGTGTSTTALKKPNAAANWSAGALRGLLVVIDSGPGSNGDSDAPIVRAIKDNTTDTATIDAVPNLAAGAVYRIVLPSVTLTKDPSPPDEVTSACLSVLDCGAPVELHGIAPADVTLQWGIYARNAVIEAHGLNLDGAASALFRAVDCDRAALYDSRLADSAIVWLSSCRVGAVERVYSDDGEALLEDCTLGSAIIEARGNTANALKFRGGSRSTAKLTANDFTAPALVLDGVGKFEPLGLVLNAAAGSRCIIVTGCAVVDLTGAALTTVAPTLEVQIDGTDYAPNWADAINFLAVTGGISRVITGGAGLQKDISAGFALNSFINGGSGQEYGGTLLLGGPPPAPGAGYVATASPTGTQAGATQMAYKFTFAQAAGAGDSMRLEPLPFTGTAIQERFGVNIGGNDIALFPPSTKLIYLFGVAQPVDAAVTWASGSRLFATQDTSGNWWIDLT